MFQKEMKRYEKYGRVMREYHSKCRDFKSHTAFFSGYKTTPAVRTIMEELGYIARGKDRYLKPVVKEITDYHVVKMYYKLQEKVAESALVTLINAANLLKKMEEAGLGDNTPLPKPKVVALDAVPEEETKPKRRKKAVQDTQSITPTYADTAVPSAPKKEKVKEGFELFGIPIWTRIRSVSD